MGGMVEYYVAHSDEADRMYESYQTMLINLSPDVKTVQGFSDNGKCVLELFVHNDNGRLVVSNDPGKKYGST